MKKISPELVCYRAMKARCYNRNHPKFKHYGGRGIAVCDHWLESFDNFIMDVGPRPSKNHSLDRLNNDLGYCKENCAWRLSIYQNRNRRSNVNLTMHGETRCLLEWSRSLRIPLNTLIQRLSKGWNPERVLYVGRFPAGRHYKNK